MTGLVAWVLVACTLLEPGQRPAVFAGYLGRVLEQEAPLYLDDDDRHKTAAVMVALAWFESRFRLDAVGDHGRSVCAYQIHHGSRALLDDPAECIRAGLRHVRHSMMTCPESPLSVYARGRCDSDEGRKLSGHRMALAKRLLAEVK